jgi:hypothetical protein
MNPSGFAMPNMPMMSPYDMYSWQGMDPRLLQQANLQMVFLSTRACLVLNV